MKRAVSVVLVALALSLAVQRASADDEDTWDIIGGTNDGGGPSGDPPPPPPGQ